MRVLIVDDQRAVILAQGPRVDVIDLPDDLGDDDRAADIQVGSLVSIDELEREHILRVVARTETLEEAARVLGIDSATLYRKRKRWSSLQASGDQRVATEKQTSS